MNRQLIYGPVASRRLGRSLGVDIIPYKICSYNCVYCQIGATPATVIQRKSYVSVPRILTELKQRLGEGINPDVITLGGSGEPTLHKEIGRIIQEVKSITDIPVAILTNGSLLADPEIQKALMDVDIVIPSFDAIDDKMFQEINRPHKAVTFENTAKGLIEFRRIYSGKIWLEIFLIKGLNDSKEVIEKFKTWCDRFLPDKVHLNTVVRPAAEAGVLPVDHEILTQYAAMLGEKAEVIVAPDLKLGNDEPSEIETRVLATLTRRPCALKDLADGLGVSEIFLPKILSELVNKGLIKQEEYDGRIFYKST